MSNAFESLHPGGPSPEALRAVVPLDAFDPRSLAFVEALSNKLLHATHSRAHPELTALAFWMRRSSLARLEKDFRRDAQSRLLVPRGTVFQIAPSNVDSIFVYSWVLSLLCGNRNIVRVPSKRSAQVDLLTTAIVELLAETEHAAIATRTILLRYTADDEVTARLSAACDVRVVWGGDATVEQVRRLPLPPSSIEMAFANKYSIALINVARWIGASEHEKSDCVNAFWNDAYWFDQMACSSPRMVLWVGAAETAQPVAEDFWARLDSLLVTRGTRLADSDYVNKLLESDRLAVDFDVTTKTGTNNTLVRVWLRNAALHVDYHCGAGMFFESAIPELGSLRPLLTRTVQSVCYFGWNAQQIREFVSAAPICGVDRFVPIGHALDFAAVWDGFDLPRMLMREITVL